MSAEEEKKQTQSASRELKAPGEYERLVGQENIEEDEGPKYKTVHLDQDVYGAAIYSIIFDCFELFSGAEDRDGLGISMSIMRISFVNIILISNYILQVAMLSFIWKYVTLPSVNRVQTLYQQYHHEIFADGKFDAHKFEDWDSQDDVCAIAFSNFWFMYFILCLWWTTMLKDVRMIERLFRSVRALEHTTILKEMLIFPGEEGDEHMQVKKVTTPVRWLLYLMIILPKFMISCLLLVIGTVWLSATDSYSDLILNAVALEFVIAIDELIFEGMLPKSIHEAIDNTVLIIVDKAVTVHDKEEVVVTQYKRSIFFYLMTIIGVYLFMTYGQYIPRLGVLPGYDGDIQCPTWIERQTDWVCSALTWQEDCFPLGSKSN